MDELPDISEHLRERHPGRIEPAIDVAEWMRCTFIDNSGRLYNPDHEHLQHARIGVLLSNVQYTRKDRMVAGEAREAEPQGANDWRRAMQKQLLHRWFGDEWNGQLPDFLITLDSVYLHDRIEEGNPYAVCALVEHELYHCAQATDRNGIPAFDDRTGRPKWTISPHDVEEFTGVIERYGAVTDDLHDTVEAAKKAPTADAADIDAACGCGASL